MATLSRQQAEEILYEEARILDSRRYDDHARLRDRLDRLNSGLAHAQNPPSKTCRLVSNVQVEQTSTDSAAVTSAFILYELRQTRQRIFAGRYQHRFRYQDGRWKIQWKKTLLVNNDEVIDNLTFIV